MRDGTRHLRLDAYLDGELPPAETEAVEAHLDACPACRDAVVADRALASACAEPLPPVEAAFLARTRARALRRAVPPAPMWWVELPAAWRLGFAALAVVAGLTGARLGRTIAADRTIATELAAALDAPATATLEAGTRAAARSPEVRR